MDKEFSLNVLNLSNQELRDSKELYINYFNTNGLYNEFYCSLILLSYYRGNLDEQVAAWNNGDLVYIEYYKDALDTFNIQLEDTKVSYSNVIALDTNISNLWVYLDEGHELKELMSVLDNDLITFETTYSEILANE